MTAKLSGVTIVIPSYNYAHTLPRALESVLRQRKGHHEVIVIDDGSTDETVVVLEKMARKYLGEFRSIRKENGGAASTRNRGIREASGPYLVFLDADDELAPGALVSIDMHLSEHSDTEMIIGGHIAVEPDGLRRNHMPGLLPENAVDRVRAYLLDKRINLANGACVMHKNVFLRGLYPERFRSSEDIPIFAQALGNNVCSVLQTPLVIIYKHSDSLRHQFVYAYATGTDLVQEVFDSSRLDNRFECLKKDYLAQRNLSLFRTAYLAGEVAQAKLYFKAAAAQNPLVLLNLSYARKALCMWFKSK